MNFIDASRWENLNVVNDTKITRKVICLTYLQVQRKGIWCTWRYFPRFSQCTHSPKSKTTITNQYRYRSYSERKRQIHVDIKIILPYASHWSGSRLSFQLWRGSGSHRYRTLTDADPDPNFHFDRIRILPTFDGPGWALRSHFQPPQLQCEPTWLLCEPP